MITHVKRGAQLKYLCIQMGDSGFVSLTQWRTTFSLFSIMFYMYLNATQYDNTLSSNILFHVSNSAYILQSTLLFSFYIDVVLTLSNRHASYNYKNTPRAQIPTMPSLRSVNQAWNSLAKPSQLEKNHGIKKVINIPSFKQQLPLVSFPTYPEYTMKLICSLAGTPLTTSRIHTHTPPTKKMNK